MIRGVATEGERYKYCRPICLGSLNPPERNCCRSCSVWDECRRIWKRKNGIPENGGVGHG